MLLWGERFGARSKALPHLPPAPEGGRDCRGESGLGVRAHEEAERALLCGSAANGVAAAVEAGALAGAFKGGGVVAMEAAGDDSAAGHGAAAAVLMHHELHSNDYSAARSTLPGGTSATVDPGAPCGSLVPMESATKAMVSDPSRSRCVERRRPLGFRTGSSPCRWGIKAPTLTAEDPGPESDEAGKRGLP